MRAPRLIRKLFRFDADSRMPPRSLAAPPVDSSCGKPPGAVPAKTILIVDDDPVILKTTSIKLQAAGYEVHTAMEGSEAISAVGQRRPDLVLLDIDFPPDVAHGGMQSWDGFRIMLWLRGLQNSEGTRFIVISGGDPAELQERALAAGAVAYFQKPIDHSALLAVIESALRAGSSKAPTPRSANFEI